MSWFSRLLGARRISGEPLTARQEQFLAGWQQVPDADLRRSHYRCRYVVVDVEASGGDPGTARLRAIAAVAVVDGQISLHDAWRLVLQEPTAGVHAGSSREVAATESLAASSLVDELIAFLGFVGKAPLVAYDARFLRRLLQRTLAEHLGVRLRQPWLDLAWILPDLFREVVSGPEPLDAWLEHFGISSIRRHEALSDAFATAQLLQIAMAHAASKGFDTPARLRELARACRQMRQIA